MIGKNFFDDRLNVYAHAEYEKADEVRAADVDWLARSTALQTVDADPSTAPYDGITDSKLFSNLRTMQRLRWGVINLANNRPGSPTSDPLTSYVTCGTPGAPPSAANYTNTNCTQLLPGKSWVFNSDGTARLADFGERVGGGLSVLNVGGDGELASEYSQYSFYPESEAKRFQVGANFKVTDDIMFRFEAKRVEEETFDEGQPTFYDIFISDSAAPNLVSPIRASNQFGIRLSDNAFMPENLRQAILTNQIDIYSAPTATAAGQLIGTAPAPYARSALRGPDRFQNNTRDLTRFVASLEGSFDQLAFAKNVDWDIGYTYGKVEVTNRERGVDSERMAFAADAVIDTAGIMGAAGQVVCRIQLLDALGVPMREVVDSTVVQPGINDAFRGGDLRASEAGRAAINECQPLNIFGVGQQSQEALDYIAAEVGVTEINEQEQLLASISGQLWDFWGAGPIGIALGGEHRREFTEGTGRDREYGDRLLFLNSGPDQQPVEYSSDEIFAELSIPLFRDSFLGQYAELSGSYRYFDYTTTGHGDVYGVNLVYRPISDIAIKTSFNTSMRVPTLSEQFSPYSETFSLFGSNDPCTTANINAAGNAEYRANRIKNCRALAQAQGLDFDFEGATPTNTDDFGPAYSTSSIKGVAGGNPSLLPEESESFTFSVVLQPRFLPDVSVVLDYYEIELTNVIATVTPAVAAANCVNGPTLNMAACNTIFRNNPNTPFGIGAPASDPVGGYISGSINYAKRSTRGMDFSLSYRKDLEELFQRNWGRIDYRLSGNYLIEQKNFNNAQDPADYTESASSIYYPRVRFTSTLAYSPNDDWRVAWSMDWQSAQDIVQARNFVANADSRLPKYMDTGNFARHDITVRYRVNDDVTLRAGVTNVFDAEQAEWLGYSMYTNFDPWGRRYHLGLNWQWN